MPHCRDGAGASKMATRHEQDWMEVVLWNGRWVGMPATIEKILKVTFRHLMFPSLAATANILMWQATAVRSPYFEIM